MLDNKILNELRGNHEKFDSFAWFGRNHYKNPENYGIWYFLNRDSSLLEESNAEVIKKELEPFTKGDSPTITYETHSHCLCGWVEGAIVKVLTAKGEYTKGALKVAELIKFIDGYPILNEEDYSEKCHEEAIRVITEEGRSIENDNPLPDNWMYQVYDYLESIGEDLTSENFFPKEELMIEAFEELGYLDPEGLEEMVALAEFRKELKEMEESHIPLGLLAA